MRRYYIRSPSGVSAVMGKRKATEEPNPAESAGGRKNRKKSTLLDINWAANDYELVWKLLTEVEKAENHGPAMS
jgi:hypothetical protein